MAILLRRTLIVKVTKNDLVDSYINKCYSNMMSNNTITPEQKAMNIREQHRILCQMYKFDTVRDSLGTIIGFKDIDRVHLHQYGSETSYADICLENYLQHPELYNSETQVKGCKCRDVLQYTKNEQRSALYGIPEHIKPIVKRDKLMNDIAYRNFHEITKLGL
jgi:hypothetical protein